MGVRKQISKPRVGDDLDDRDRAILRGVLERKPVKEIADELDVSDDVVYWTLRGMIGYKESLKPRYRFDVKYLREAQGPQRNIKYELNEDGLRVLASQGEGPFNRKKDGEEGDHGRVVTDEERAGWETMVRPHELVSNHRIDRMGDDLDMAWFQQRSDTELLEAENGKGLRLYYKGSKVEVYPSTGQVTVHMEYGRSPEPVDELMRRYWEDRDDLLAHIEERFRSVATKTGDAVGIQVRRRPETFSSMLGPVKQEWADVGNALAELVVEEKDRFGDDEPGVLWMVRDEDGTPVATVDCSPKPDGSTTPELEFLHPEMGKQHLQNIKDLVLWGASYEITPQDFKNLRWLREHFNSFRRYIDAHEKLRSRMDELEERLGDVVERVDVVRERQEEVVDRVESVGEDVEDVAADLSRVKSGYGRNLEMLNDVAEKHEERMRKAENTQEMVAENISRLQQRVVRVERSRWTNRLRRVGGRVVRRAKAVVSRWSRDALDRVNMR